MRAWPRWQPPALLALLLVFCRGTASSPAAPAPRALRLVADVPLPGRPVRFDYQDIDSVRGHLFISHMSDASVVVVSTADGRLVKVLGNIPTPRGIVVAPEIRRVFVTSLPSSLVIIDGDSLAELGRVSTGDGPDGVAWDSLHRIVAVSDQRAGAISLLSEDGAGQRRQLALGRETGNVTFDARRSLFWITVVNGAGPDALVGVDPSSVKAITRLSLPGCSGAHGLRLHPDGDSALIACEDNATVLRVGLDGGKSLSRAEAGAEPDVLAVDAGLARLYVAAESGDLRIFDLSRPGLVELARARPGNASHSVAVDRATHHVFFPLAVGPKGAPVLRIMRPNAG